MSENDQLMKVDVRGRVWTPRERREELLDEFERSGMPASRFAAHIGVKYATFAVWAQKRRKQRSAPAKLGSVAAAHWVEAVSASASGGALCMHLPGDVRMEIHDVSQAKLAAEFVRAFAMNHGNRVSGC